MPQLDDALEVVQWFFDLEKVMAGFNWPVNVQGLVGAKRRLDAVTAAKASAEDVLDAYRAFAGAVGPTAMSSLLESDDAFPEVNHSEKPTPPSPGKVTLYVAPDGKRVTAACSKAFGIPPTLTVE